VFFYCPPFAIKAWTIRRCEKLQNRARRQSGDDRIRTPPENDSNSSGSGEGGAKSGALGAPEAAFDPELAAIVVAWPALPAAIKAGIMAMVRATR
jgi:hypothetical protein